MSISRTELKYQLGLGKVSDITSVRKALGHRKWQNAQIEDCDIDEVREYYRLVREKMMAPADALIQVSSERNGYAEQCDQIDDMAIDHSQHRDGEEETNGMVLAVRSVTQEASLAMTDVADAASEQIVDAFYIALGANVMDKIQNRAEQVRSNFGQISEAIRQTPMDLRKGSLPGKKTETKQISGLWG
ncbi:MAG: hypothetical protein [Phormidium phage MIS-PhV1A]|uniref:hypothetical protein n=1 Tax=Phormidium phage MIS-PhV1A TaxID=1391455 RepID=UPI0003C95C84|nr:MAG: hypothetical protein AV945_gp56 [Phormidium phage MIS-PhV1A]AGZ61801.1 MAG: hypothetical protein [Phormidium phage MIS-PhV1A]HAT12602.1 hypothetical protein [Microcoleaceae cyanobacterium UBA11344]